MEWNAFIFRPKSVHGIVIHHLASVRASLSRADVVVARDEGTLWVLSSHAFLEGHLERFWPPAEAGLEVCAERRGRFSWVKTGV
jgi:hypothetical protein